MTEEEKRVRIIVQDELIGILSDAHEQLGVKKDPTGMARKEAIALLDRVGIPDAARRSSLPASRTSSAAIRSGRAPS